MSLPATNKPLDHLTLSKVGVQEESAELNQIICKIDRFGLRSYHPATFVSNIEELAGELGDLYGAMGFYVAELTNVLTPDELALFNSILNERCLKKRDKLIDYNERRGGEGA